MALLTPTTVKTMDYSYQGSPFVNVPATSAVITNSLDYSFQGEPFATNDFIPGPRSVKTVNGLAIASVKTWNKVT